MNRRNVLIATTFAALGARFSPDALAAEREEGGRSGAVNVNDVVVRYLAAWNEQDARRRHDLIAATWTEDGTYVDRAREGHGHESIDGMIAKAQGQFPGYRLSLASGIEAHHDYLRFSWTAGGTADAPLYIKGTDFALMAEDGRFRSVIGFVDAAPAPVSR